MTHTFIFILICYAGFLTIETATTSYSVDSSRSAIKCGQSKNNPPVVHISQPLDNTHHERNAFVQYSITVSDVEDGESRFDEIPASQIFLQIRHAQEAGSLSNGVTAQENLEPEGFRQVRTSDCFNCHRFRGKSIGPPFTDIAKRYFGSSAGALLAEKIRNGSSGVWGDGVMPAHPDVSPEAAQTISNWILTAGTRDFDDYLQGKEGLFRITVPENSKGGQLILTAHYSDQGLPGRKDLSISSVASHVIHYK